MLMVERGLVISQSCLNVKSVDGFEKKSLPSGKVWWQGTQPGHSIEIIMPGTTCSEINVFHNLRVTNGMVRVQVDSLVPEGPLTNGILDGWFKGFFFFLGYQRKGVTMLKLSLQLTFQKQSNILFASQSSTKPILRTIHTNLILLEWLVQNKVNSAL